MGVLKDQATVTKIQEKIQRAFDINRKQTLKLLWKTSSLDKTWRDWKRLKWVGKKHCTVKRGSGNSQTAWVSFGKLRKTSQSPLYLRGWKPGWLALHVSDKTMSDGGFRKRGPHYHVSLFKLP